MELEKVLLMVRKARREVAELKAVRARLVVLKTPDVKLLAKVDAEIKAREMDLLLRDVASQ